MEQICPHFRFRRCGVVFFAAPDDEITISQLRDHYPIG